MNSDLLSEARRLASQPILRRAYHADDVPLEYRDTRAAALTNNRREWFTLSIADSFQTRALADTLPLVALAARATGETKLKEYCLAQLEEMKSWQPLNRPGWSLYLPGPPAPENYNDGNWLGTAWGIRALTSTLEALGERVPAPLSAALHELMRKEILGVRDDFKTRRVWFWNAPVSNQFVLPNCAVLLACLELQKPRGDDDYEFAIANLLRALDMQGHDGAFHEGATYGSLTQKEILNAGLLCARGSDVRLITHPHLQNFGRWLLHMVQPGLPPLQPRLVNAFDANDRSLEVNRDNPARDPNHPMNKMQLTSGFGILDALMLHAMATHDPQVVWLLQNVPPQLPLTAIAAEYSDWQTREKPTTETPPAFASFSSSPLAVWRSSWKLDASGVWVRGGSTHDSHDHADRGHVNVIFKGKEVLIEVGSSDYATPDYARVFQSGVGHNVLQIGASEAEANAVDGMAKRASNAPIEVLRLEDNGGEIVVDASAAYNSQVLQSWKRRVRWNESEVTIDDAVQLAPNASQTILFRFHLGKEVTPQLRSANDGKCAEAQWNQGRIAFCADVSLALTTSTHVHGFSYTKTAKHTVLLVASREKLSTLHLTTTLNARDF